MPLIPGVWLQGAAHWTSFLRGTGSAVFMRRGTLGLVGPSRRFAEPPASRAPALPSGLVEIGLGVIARGLGERLVLDLLRLGLGERLLDGVDAAGLRALAAADQEPDGDLGEGHLFAEAV